MRAMIVCKFGGTSVQDAAAIPRLAMIVAARRAEQPVVVVSALARVTDSLVRSPRRCARATARRDQRRPRRRCSTRHDVVASCAAGRRDGAAGACRRTSPTLRDRCVRAAAAPSRPPSATSSLGQGELWSSRLVAAALEGVGTARRVGRRAPGHGHRRPLRPRHARSSTLIRSRAQEELAPLLAAGRIPVTQGFIGATASGVAHHARPRRLRLHRVAARCRPRRHAGRDLDRRRRPHDRRSAPRPLGPHARLGHVRGGRGARDVRRQGAAPRHAAAARRAPASRSSSSTPCIPTGPAPSSGHPRLDAATADEPIRSISWKRGTIVVNVRAPRMLGAYGFLRQLFEVFERHEVVVDVLASERGERVAHHRGRDAGSTALVRDLAALGEVSVEEDRAIVAARGPGHQAHRRPRPAHLRRGGADQRGDDLAWAPPPST